MYLIIENVGIPPFLYIFVLYTKFSCHKCVINLVYKTKCIQKFVKMGWVCTFCIYFVYILYRSVVHLVQFLYKMYSYTVSVWATSFQCFCCFICLVCCCCCCCCLLSFTVDFSISRSKSNQGKKFGQLLKQQKNVVEELFPDSFLKNQN